MLSYENFKKEALARPGVKKAYDELIADFEIKRKLIQMRKEANLTQAELAERMHTTKTAISRIESLNSKTMPSYQTLLNYANAFGKKLSLEFI